MIKQAALFFYCSFFALSSVTSALPDNTQDDSIEMQLLEKKPYIKPATCSADVWAAMEPYFLPADHVIRKKLDLIFSESRVLDSLKSLKKAGFIDPYSKDENNAFVMKHPRVPGFIFKAYLDTQWVDDWWKLLRRIQGALLVQSTIDEFGFNSMIKVPKKWIYPLPPEPRSKTGDSYNPKHFILVAQDVGVLSSKGNAYAWKHTMTYELLTALYIIIKDNRMTDSIRIQNIPFCHDGKVAFVDTEFFNVPEDYATIRFWKLYDYLSSEMAQYLKGLAENGVPL